MKQEEKKIYKPKNNNILKLRSYLSKKDKNGKSN
jgi:hypothetical protein